MLSELQQDALREFMNINIGQAASLLSEMTGDKVILTIPEVQLLPAEQIDISYKSSLPDFLKGHVMSSAIKFGKVFNGKAHLVFPVDKSKKLVSLCMGEYDQDDGHGEEDFINSLTDTDFDAVKEIGNIVLNSVVGGLGNLMEVKLEYALPEIEVMFFPEMNYELPLEQSLFLLLIRNTFSFDKTVIEGAIVVILAVDSIEFLLKRIDKVIADYYE